MASRPQSTPDREPTPGEARTEGSHTGLRRPSKAPWIILALVVIAGVAAAVHWLGQRPKPPAEAPRAASSEAAPPSVPESPPGPAPTVNPDTVRAMLESLSPDALFRKWLAEGDLVRRWVVVTDNLAEGVSPRAQLAFLAPGARFSAEDRRGTLVLYPASCQRYDAFARAVSTLDARALATVYRNLHPVLDAAYRALGYPDRSIDSVTARALRRILSAPVRDGDVELQPRGNVFVFADPELERLTAVEKHLLRMGPENTRLLQAKAREIEAALRLPAEAGSARR